MPVRDSNYHDCPHAGADGKRCKGKASIVSRDPQGRTVYKCTRCAKPTTDDELRRRSLARTPPDDD